MVETRRSSASSAASNRPASSSSASASSPSLPKRPKVSEDVLWAKDLGAEPLDSGARSCDPQLNDVKASDAEKTSVNMACGTSQPVGEVMLDVGKANGHKRRSLKVAKKNTRAVWGQLLSQSSQNLHLVMRENSFTVGQGRQCNLCLSDPSISNVLCKIKHIVREDSSATVLEISGCKGVVQVNGKIYGRNNSVLLFGGDEVVFSAEGDHSYVFQQFDDNLPYRGLASEFMLEAQSSPMNEMQMETRPGDPSILASLTDFQEDISLLPPPGKSGVDVQRDSEIYVEQSVCGLSDDQLGDTGMRESSNNDDVADVVKLEEKGVDPSTECNEETVNMDTDISDASRGVGSEKMPSDRTKIVLIGSTFIRLKCNEFVKYASDLPILSPWIILSGPAGSEIYQETLTKALAKHFAAKPLIVDSLLLPGDTLSKDVVSTKEFVKLEKPSVFSKVRHSTADLPKKPTSSVEAVITGGSAACCKAQLKQEVSTATSKTYKFRGSSEICWAYFVCSFYTTTFKPIHFDWSARWGKRLITLPLMKFLRLS